MFQTEQTELKGPNIQTECNTSMKPNITKIILCFKSNRPNLRDQTCRRFLTFQTERTESKRPNIQTECNTSMKPNITKIILCFKPNRPHLRDQTFKLNVPNL